MFIQNILLLLIDGHHDENKLNRQIDALHDQGYTYTGAGLIVTFKKDDTINNYKIDFDKILNGVEITSSELDIGAEANLFIENGIISYLEIFSKSSLYPKKPLEDYNLYQAWLPKGRQIQYP